MDGNEILLLGLKIQSPWEMMHQHLDIQRQPHELHLPVGSDRGAKYECPACGASCTAHDFSRENLVHTPLPQGGRSEDVFGFIRAN